MSTSSNRMWKNSQTQSRRQGTWEKNGALVCAAPTALVFSLVCSWPSASALG